MYSDKENVNILTALLVEYGVRHVVVCPGSRNAPLVHNFNECPDIECHPVTDERSAAFVALGLRHRSEGLVAVCVTSGSALLNTLPGVAEASYQKRGIIIISADRPASWIGQLDGQTMPQPGALGEFVAKSVSLPECKDDDERWHCRRLICEAVLAYANTGKSVHINVPISEPLFSFTEKALPTVKPVSLLNWHNDRTRSVFYRLIDAAKRPMIVIGQMPRFNIQDEILERVSRYVVTLAEPLSVENVTPSLDVLFNLMGAKTAAYKPDLVLYFGGNTISKKLRHFLRSLNGCEVIMVNPLGVIEDVSQHASYIMKASATEVLKDLAMQLCGTRSKVFYNKWQDLIAQTRAAIADAPMSLTDKAIKLLEEQTGEDDMVYYANSTSVRLAAKYAERYVYCNRGLNGIEGSMSTAVGASLACDDEDRVYCVIGDLSFFYDQNALWNTELRGNLRILLLNDGGGKIFSTLPGLKESSAISFISAQHDVKAENACRQYKIKYRSITDETELNAAIDWLTQTESDRPLLLEINV